jgi:uncharacterized cofD-like protein
MSPDKKAKVFYRAWQRFRQELRWLIPGIGVKRWILVILAGTTLLGIGLATLVLEVYRTAPETWWLPILSFLSLRALARPLRVLIFGGIGVGLIAVGTWGLNRSLLRPFVPHGKTVLQALEGFRRRERGPRIVAIGGGHGLAALLRGIKEYTHNITAIVTVADDGGSSGELRRTMGILPPGDIRNCLAALSDDEALLGQIFQYRFSAGAGLNGHSLGNLFISALTDITGSFEEAIAESGRVLAAHGRVLPASLHDVRLGADIQYSTSSQRIYLTGESRIPESGGQIKRVWLEPANATAFPPAIAAILSADLVIIGPGSLYTSILPNLLVPDLTEALRASRAIKFFVCNLATEPGETDTYHCGDHLRAIEKHTGKYMIDLVICNKTFQGKLPEGSQWVTPEAELEDNYNIYFAELNDPGAPGQHISSRLAQVIMDLFYERTGPLANQ